MTAQEIGVFVLGAAALGYLVLRFARRRRSGNCCGESECPAARQIVERLDRASK